MGRKISSMVALFVVLAATLLQSTFAENYTVGDTSGWTVPTSNANLYENWAANKNFVVGDTLVFNFATGRHDVANVTEAAYDNCNTTNTIFIWTNGPATVTLNTTGDWYFICTFPGHCIGGQKLKVEVKNGNGTTSAPTPGSSTSPSSPSSASSLIASVSLVFISSALVFFC